MNLMDWFDPFGAGMMVLLLIPNVFLKLQSAAGRVPWGNKVFGVAEQVGRYGCVCFMIVHFPGMGFGYRSVGIFVVSTAVCFALSLSYVIAWGILRKRDTLARALILSILPTLVFLLHGAASCSIPLIVAALLFGVAHITISVKNAG